MEHPILVAQGSITASRAFHAVQEMMHDWHRRGDTLSNALTGESYRSLTASIPRRPSTRLREESHLSNSRPATSLDQHPFTPQTFPFALLLSPSRGVGKGAGG